ncbi:MAG: hypothetical protein L0I29_00710 [Hyphomicrobiales bacterium]|nr:hypothetical protein [Hyphomicrobiales bacterium]
MQLGLCKTADLPCLDIAAISVEKALLWHSVEIRSRGRTDRLSCLGQEAAIQLAADLYSFINVHLSDVVGSEADRLNEVDVRLRAITEHQRQYLAHADLARAIAAVPGKAAAALSHPLFDPEMMPAHLKDALPSSFALLTDPATRKNYNDTFVSAELGRCRPFFDDLDGRSLSEQQREACIRLEDNNLLIASAGYRAGSRMTNCSIWSCLDQRPSNMPKSDVSSMSP